MPPQTLAAHIVLGIASIGWGLAGAQGPAAPAEQQPLAGLTAPVEVTMDNREVPTIEARSALDAFRVQGFVHAQARFAQMDAMRRLSAGETAELLGKASVNRDMALREFRGREVARACIEALSPEERAMLAAYVAGVNDGIAALPMPPMEHTLLGLKPAAWKPEDCALVYLSMFHSLARTGRHDDTFQRVLQQLPPQVSAFLASPLSRFDCPIIADGADCVLPPIPDGSVIDLRATPQAHAHSQGLDSTALMDLNWLEWQMRGALAGSNAWAVAGSKTGDGQAILANDPHLQITAPILWYRCRLQWHGVDWTGLSIPGVPGIVIGTNGMVAVGFTNTAGDFEDLVIVDVDPNDSTRYLTPTGSEPFGEVIETIHVRGGKDVEHRMRTTKWGVVSGTTRYDDDVERPVVSLWVGARAEAINFDILKMSGAKTVDEAATVLASWHGPSQNGLIADSSGRIGWVMTGWIPERNGHDPRLPWRPTVDGEPWATSIPEERRPMVIDPPEGFIVSANHRSIPIDRCADIGYYWANPERAHRIRERLIESTAAPSAAAPVTELDMLDIQLDTQVSGLEPYRAMVLGAIPTAESDEALARARALAAAWNGRADADQPAVAFLGAMQREVARSMEQAVARWCRTRTGQDLKFRTVVDEPWLRVVEARAPNWLPPEFATWDECLQDCARRALKNEPGDASWGERNAAQFMSPVAEAVPEPLRPALTLDTGPQAGHFRAVRVQTPRAAASARLIVSPGHEADGILETPGGQSGDPRSPHYRSFHQEWRDGAPTPLLPGAPVKSIEFVPPGK
ncbi:MAG: penicillin acylase family protein [Planctomycetota bacterium]|nr:penicillin acylase family protein [Planctomycetota bacterium]